MSQSYFLVGRNITHSLSPALHRAAFAANDTHATYELRDVATVDDALRVVPGAAGLNVTAPYKSAFFETFVDVADEVARRAQAVNTVQVIDGKITNVTNTDVLGLVTTIRALTERRSFDGVVVVIGAGGAARAALVALDILGVHDVFLEVRADSSQRQSLEQTLASLTLRPRFIRPTSKPRIVIHAASVWPAPSSTLGELDVDENSVVVDLRYRETEGARAAATTLGCAFENGLALLVEQADFAQRTWGTRTEAGRRAMDFVIDDAKKSDTSRQ